MQPITIHIPAIDITGLVVIAISFLAILLGSFIVGYWRGLDDQARDRDKMVRRLNSGEYGDSRVHPLDMRRGRGRR